MKTTIILVTTTLLAALTSASPIDRRAGAPAAEPIPSNCTVLNPLPHSACGTGHVDGLKPSDKFYQENMIYESYYTPVGSMQENAKLCRQQCYGYGNTGDCKSSFVGYQIPVPKGYYGSDGGELKMGCLLFAKNMLPMDFVEAPQGQYLNLTSASIYCPGI